jgi:hypothetical protein
MQDQVPEGGRRIVLFADRPAGIGDPVRPLRIFAQRGKLNHEIFNAVKLTIMLPGREEMVEAGPFTLQEAATGKNRFEGTAGCDGDLVFLGYGERFASARIEGETVSGERVSVLCDRQRLQAAAIEVVLFDIRTRVRQGGGVGQSVHPRGSGKEQAFCFPAAIDPAPKGGDEVQFHQRRLSH